MKFEMRANRRFAFRERVIKLKIFLIRNTAKNSIEIDRRIVLLLSKEVFAKGGTTEAFQNELYEFLDYCKANKSEDEFHHLVSLFRSSLNRI